MDNSKKILEKIKSENIQPIPRWKFVLKNVSLWAVFSIAVIFGALAFSIVLFSIQQSEFDLLSHMSHSRLEFFLGLLPFFWIISLVTFLILAIFSIQHSKKGYKFTVSRLVGISTALSILLGTLFFIGGGAERLENAFAVNVALYESIQEKKIKTWMKPDEGFLSGTISKTNSNSFELTDFNEKIWVVFYEDAFIPPRIMLEPGEMIKLVGQIVEDNKFRADEIRPWGGPGNRNQRRGQQN
ncbi:MAG: hypothetical protein DWQ02_17270 [Bacteroidetes bacterium]|nr:MAG: hypothetical protein DWQ02_17270 [Bacteroidota bacterium]